MSGQAFRFSTTIRVRWGDCDAFGHVNNASYLSYFEEARIDYWKAVVPDVPFTGMAIVHASVDFRGQAFPGDVLTIRAGDDRTAAARVSGQTTKCCAARP